MGLNKPSKKNKKLQKGFYIHFKFEGNSNTLRELDKKANIDNSILRSLTVKYKKLDLKKEYFHRK